MGHSTEQANAAFNLIFTPTEEGVTKAALDLYADILALHGRDPANSGLIPRGYQSAGRILLQYKESGEPSGFSMFFERLVAANPRWAHAVHSIFRQPGKIQPPFALPDWPHDPDADYWTPPPPDGGKAG